MTPEKTSSLLTKYRRRSPAQWRKLLSDPSLTDETPAQLAERFDCCVATIKTQMARVKKTKVANAGGFVEITAKPSGAAAPAAALHLQTPNGVTLTFPQLPPPDYLAATLGLVG